MKTPPQAARARFHAFLRRLRANGRSNMYGAVPYLMRTFSLDRDTAFHVVCDWLDAQEGAQPTAHSAPERLPRRTGAGRGSERKKRGTRA